MIFLSKFWNFFWAEKLMLSSVSFFCKGKSLVCCQTFCLMRWVFTAHDLHFNHIMIFPSVIPMLFPSANFFEPYFFICFCCPCIIRYDIQIYFVKSEDFKSILEEELNTFGSIALRPIVFVENCDSKLGIPVFSVDFKGNVSDILFALNQIVKTLIFGFLIMWS